MILWINMLWQLHSAIGAASEMVSLSLGINWVSISWDHLGWQSKVFKGDGGYNHTSSLYFRLQHDELSS